MTGCDDALDAAVADTPLDDDPPPVDVDAVEVSLDVVCVLVARGARLADGHRGEGR